MIFYERMRFCARQRVPELCNLHRCSWAPVMCMYIIWPLSNYSGFCLLSTFLYIVTNTFQNTHFHRAPKQPNNSTGWIKVKQPLLHLATATILRGAANSPKMCSHSASGISIRLPPKHEFVPLVLAHTQLWLLLCTFQLLVSRSCKVWRLFLFPSVLSYIHQVTSSTRYKIGVCQRQWQWWP